MPLTSPSLFRLTDDMRRCVGKQQAGEGSIQDLDSCLTLAERRLEAASESLDMSLPRCLLRRER